MPGVIMENGSRNGLHTNHDRDQWPNGVNGANYGSEKVQDKGKGRAEPLQNVSPVSPPGSNGLNGSFTTDSRQQRDGRSVIPPDLQGRINELPEEIAHITQGFLPLSTLLSRLAQKSHNNLLSTIADLAQMPVPASAANGSTAHSTADDTSAENLSKKSRLIKFAESTHTEWTKALVLAEWSRKSNGMSKIIDLNFHLGKQAHSYQYAISTLDAIRHDLPRAQLPNPDLKTAVEVLTTGKASWMPELGYIEPPPLTAREILKDLENLNTLLSIRLNIHDYDKIPLQFKDYIIKSGRVTFRVAGEFELDLTIADESPDSQFWCIDFRFMFSPSLSAFSPDVRLHIENRVNTALEQDGLAGSYKYLHEITLTQKISEYRKQAFELSRGKWVEGLKLELLNRSLCIQYWLDRFPNGPKSWILLGVHSGRTKNGLANPKASSRLSIRWFRDSKEMKDINIPFDTVNISAEALLKTVIARHTNHILTSMHEKLRAKPLYANRHLGLSLVTSATEPIDSELKVQLTKTLELSVRIEPVTGRFILGPHSRRVSEWEANMNKRSQDPANDAHSLIDGLRCALITDDIFARSLSVGWLRTPNPGLKFEEMKVYMPKDAMQVLWLKRQGWARDWYLAISLSMSGERWWLIQTNNSTPAPKIASCVSIPIKSVSPTPTYAFLSTLSLFAAAIICHYSNLRVLHSRRALHMLRSAKEVKGVNLPSIYVRLSELLPSKNRSSRTDKPWAKDIIKLTFQGLETVPDATENPALQTTQSQASQAVLPGIQTNDPVTQKPVIAQEIAVMVTEARMLVPLPKSLTNINEMVDRDIAFHPESGSFAFRLRSKIGDSVISTLIERAVRIERLVEFVQVLQKHENVLHCETVSLGKIVFTYGKRGLDVGSADTMAIDDSTPGYKAVVDFSAVENIIILVLEKGNPHLRILDHLTKILNEGQGLDGVAHLLPRTLPVVRALDTMELAWSSMLEHGELYVYVRAADWYVIRYNLFAPPSESGSQPKETRYMFEIRLRHKKSEQWWYLRRIDSPERTRDEMDNALKSVWDSAGNGWKGMRVSGVAQTEGAEELLLKMDEAVRNLAFNTKAVEAAIPVPAPTIQARAPAPAQRQLQPNQRQQQPTPNHSQGNSQGRSNPVKREIVEID